MECWRKCKIEVIDKQSGEFPKLLKEIVNCPKKLFFRGKWDPLLFDNTLSIVGSRGLSRYGSQVIENWMPDFVNDNLTIISGFMYGADTKAHRECLKNGGQTIAVLGSGLNKPTPVANLDLYDKVVNGRGLVISEYDPEMKAAPWSFPQRNRIVAALATKGVLVVEAGLNSGSMITADLGRKFGKKVYAVPGWVTSDLAKGTNLLIKQGWAELVSEPSDITNSRRSYQQGVLFEDSNPNVVTILKQIDAGGVSADSISNGLKMPMPQLLSLLSNLCLKGIIWEENGLFFRYK